MKQKVMSNTTGNNVIALIAGVAIGVGLGFLFAPEKGSKTREKIKEGFEDIKEEAKNKFSNSTEDLKEKVENFLSDSSYKAEEAIAYLEEKLAELKKQNAKLQK